jgi:hypothetical protein
VTSRRNSRLIIDTLELEDMTWPTFKPTTAVRRRQGWARSIDALEIGLVLDEK